MKDFTSKLLGHHKKYLLMLQTLPNDYDTYEDLLRLERYSDLFFLLKAFALLKKEDWLLKKTVPEKVKILKIISIFALIDDIHLKLHILERFINEGSLVSYTFSKDLGHPSLFRLLFVQMPLLKQKLLQSINNGNKRLANSQKRRQLKIKLRPYAFLRQINLYNVDNFNLLLSEEDLSIVRDYIENTTEYEYDDIFMELYKHVKKTRDIYENHSSEITEQIGGKMNELSASKIKGENINWRALVDLKLHECVETNILSKLNLSNEFKIFNYDISEYFEGEEQENC